MDIKIYDVVNKPLGLEKVEIIDFLHTHLEQYGDPKDQIQKAIDYSIKEFISFGGFTAVIHDEGKIKGAAVINQTGMGGYIPENILVYIAIDSSCRGEGIGSKLMKKVIDFTKGDIALHVEPTNPAKGLYERLGFTNPYLEMRLKK